MVADRLKRTFLAVELPHQVKQVAIQLQTTVDAKPKVVKWVKAANIHLTLRFIGPTPEEEISKIKSAVAEAVKGFHDIKLRVNGTGVFPKPQRPRILWLGVEGDVEPLCELVTEINRALSEMGYPAEERSYTPHITIARIRYPQKVTPDVTTFLNCEYDPIDVSVENVTFLQSDLVPGGPIYTLLGVHHLSPQEATASDL